MFDEHEIDILIEAMEAWENQKMSSAMMAGLLGAMLTKDPEGRKAEFENTMNEARVATEQRKEDAILLKAKLIQLKRHSLAGEAAEYLRVGQSPA